MTDKFAPLSTHVQKKVWGHRPGALSQILRGTWLKSWPVYVFHLDPNPKAGQDLPCDLQFNAADDAAAQEYVRATYNLDRLTAEGTRYHLAQIGTDQRIVNL